MLQQGASPYYEELLKDADPVLVVGAWCAFLDAKALPPKYWNPVVPWCRFEAVRNRTFRYFETVMQFDRARSIALIDVESRSELERRAALARLDHDFGRTEAAEVDLYFATGSLDHLRNASAARETALGWRAGLEWAIRAALVAPMNPAPVHRIFSLLESSGQADLLEEMANIYLRWKMFPQIVQIFLAAAALARRSYTRCLTLLAPFDDGRIATNPNLPAFLGSIRMMQAQAEEGLGNYNKAYAAYITMNQVDRPADSATKAQNFFTVAKWHDDLAVPDLPADSHPEVVQMLGFPRSGTTLLENALAAHSQIETFEEIVSVSVALDRIARGLNGDLPPESAEATFGAARGRYYAYIEANRRRPEAQILVDKMPMRSAEAKLLSKLFPEWRYIFSIRHPFDVVLSGFKQRFDSNPSMENLRSIELAARLYDFVMTQWFSVHSLDDPHVKYVRYDELVTDFRRVIGETLEFIGAPWDDAVLDFAKASEKRAVKTPSYLKVRQGLSIGVQSSWRNYDFVFRSPAAQPLHKWAEFFGYPTK